MVDEPFFAAIERLDTLVQEFDGLPYPQIRELVFELLQLIDTVHREALGRWVARLRIEGREAWVEEAARDPAIRTLLLLYDLIPDDELDRMERASAFVPLESVEGGDRAESFIPLELVIQPPVARYHSVLPLDELPAESMSRVEVEGVGLLVAHVEGKIVATRNQCPGSMAPLELGTFRPPLIICPWHNELFDLRTGQRADGVRQPTLTLLPVRVRDGMIEVELEPPGTP